MGRPKANSSLAEREMDKAEDQFKKFDDEIKEMTLDRLNETPKPDLEPQTKLSQKQIEKSKEIYLKPHRTVSDGQKFNEKYRTDWEFQKEYVQFVAENKEIIGEDIDIWTHPFGGVNAQWWKVPVNKPVWGPRYLAEQLKRKFYHRLVMQQNVNGSDGHGQYYGTMAVDTTVQRLDATPVSSRKSLFMGASN
jgi:hypothetical protein